MPRSKLAIVNITLVSMGARRSSTPALARRRGYTITVLVEELVELADRRVLQRPDGPLDDTVPAHRPITVEDVLSFRLGWGLDFNVKAPCVQAVGLLPGFGIPNPAWPGEGWKSFCVPQAAWMGQVQNPRSRSSVNGRCGHSDA